MKGRGDPIGPRQDRIVDSCTFTIVRPRRAIFCNGLQRVFPQPLEPAPYFEAFTVPFGCSQGRLEFVPKTETKLKTQHKELKRRTPV